MNSRPGSERPTGKIGFLLAAVYVSVFVISLQIRFKLNEIDDEFFAGGGFFVVEGDDLIWGLGAEDDAVEVDLADAAVAFASASVDMDEALVAEYLNTF